MNYEDVSVCNNWLNSYRSVTVQNWDTLYSLDTGHGERGYLTAWLDVTDLLESVVVLTDNLHRNLDRALIIANPTPGSIPSGFTITLVNALPWYEVFYLFYEDGNGDIVPAKMMVQDYSNPAAYLLYRGDSIRMTAVYRDGEFFWLRNTVDAW